MDDTKYLHSTLLLMTYGGTFKIKTGSSLRRLLFSLLRGMVNLVLVSFMLSCFIDLRIKGFTNLEHVSKHYAHLVFTPYIVLRANYHYVYDRVSSDIVKEMRGVFKYKTDTGFEEKDLRNYVKATKLLTTIWIFYGTLLSQFDILLRSILNKEREPALPMWFPFDWAVSPYYEMVVLLQMFIQQVTVVAAIGMDAFFANTLILTSGQFKLLGWELKHVLQKTLLENDVQLNTVLKFMRSLRDNTSTLNTEDTALLDVLNSHKFRINLLENLKVLINFHKSLVSISSRLDEFFSTPNLMCFCLLLSDVVLLENALIIAQNMMFKIFVIMYVLTALTMLFYPCFFGTLLSLHAEAILNDLYDLPWYMCDSKFRTNFKMLQQKASKPILLRIGKFGELSLGTFLWILKASYSYLTVLRQVTVNEFYNNQTAKIK